LKDYVFNNNTIVSGVRPLSTALKALEVLDLLGAEEKPLRLAEVAQAKRISRATAYQRLLTLVRAGWVEQTPDGAYRLSMQAVRVGIAALAQAGLGERIAPQLHILVAESGETASIAVLEGTHCRIVQRVEAAGVLRAELRIGALLDLEHSASGRVLVAFADPALVKHLREKGVPLPSEKVLAQVRRERFAASSGKSFPGVRATAVPIFDRMGHCIAALSLVGPVPRFSIDKTRAPLKRAAEAIHAVIHGAPA
jgi:DNA-binding IclR family transcriptional regulator